MTDAPHRIWAMPARKLMWTEDNTHGIEVRGYCEYILATREALLASLEVQALTGWQPIETAPKDGTQFQAWLTDGRAGRNPLQHWEPLCRFNSDGAFEIWGRIDYDMDGWKTDWNPDWKPTHWMPLPTPPTR